ncbi:pheromone A receptor-domain-containing protein [Boeremia exigua]|uniref:pheromone A receptor-domain-containing protein n=1 Tax=Boeremia exigua TaxID=749465 RepID=UPI001E8E186A|nr:pheromone A receptor-domain-containing protein [Boeremia exigua]KAH6622252.1 pheromone A receptor-domain-containing protein [Boeremia exigua]
MEIMSTGDVTGDVYPTAILFSVLAWFSWLLCIAPLVWHISQRNVAASSLVLWIILTNFPLGINAIIWGHDNIDQWWDGAVWCDINVRIQVGAQVSLGAAVAMILRRLAQVMDTRNITVSLSRSSKLRRQLVELAWCWAYPLVMILLYIPIQSVRYHISGIEGCNSGYDPNWRSLVLNVMWVLITMLAVVYYAVLLLFRLFRYRREFSRLVSARNTTRSRFLRLFLMCMVFLFTVVAYSVYSFYYFCNAMVTYELDTAWWDSIEGDKRKVILKFRSDGAVHVDKWGQIGLGYIAFLLFGTGTDAYNTYKKMLLAIGLGKLFPSLYIMHDTASSTPSSFVKAKSYFSKGTSRFSSFGGSTFNTSMRSDSVALDTLDRPALRSVSSTTPVLHDHSEPLAPSLLKRIFTRGRHQPILPVFSQRSLTPQPEKDTATDTVTEGFSARAWASEAPSSRRTSEPSGVIVFREVHLDEEIRASAERNENTHGTVEVCGNEQFVLGRDMKCRYSWYDDFTISREHLRIHCILYEQDPVANIAPFVYATDLSANGTYLRKSNADCTGSQGRGILMGQNGSFLLDDGDELQLSETVTLIYRSVGAVMQSVLTATQEREKAVLSSRYLITNRLLGEGGYGKVLIGIDQITQRQLACKMVNLEKLYDRRADLFASTNDAQQPSNQAINELPLNVQNCFREFDILKDLSHPNIVHIQRVFWSRSTIYMFQELVTGGDLFSYIQYKHGKIPIIESAVIIRQVLKGVQYLHDHDVVHRDLKPDNILMTSLDNGARVVITDFGHARFLPNANTQRDFTSNKLKRMYSVVGTLEYAAPEIHRANDAIPSTSGYSLSVDMWSIGSITAAILTGEILFSCRNDGPFEEDPRRVIVGLAAECDLSILDDKYHPLWGPIAPAPKDFIKRLLVLDEEDRMSATEALEHIWFTHPMMSAEFEAQYERAIKKWRPRLLNQTSGERKASDRSSIDGTQSHFLSSKRTPDPNDLTDECHRTGNAQRRDQLYQDYAVGTHRDYADDYTESNEGQDASLDQQSEGQEYAEDEPDDAPTPPTNDSRGQLHRVNTSTRGRYFQREIVDLDDLNTPTHESNEGVNVVEPNSERGDAAKQYGRLRREETVQVRRTPPVGNEACDSLEQWGQHRDQQTQFHYDTQAETMTQDDDILVQDTPPEMVLEPKVTSTNRERRDFDQNCRQYVYEVPLAHKVGKPKKVYGRRR